MECHGKDRVKDDRFLIGWCGWIVVTTQLDYIEGIERWALGRERYGEFCLHQTEFRSGGLTSRLEISSRYLDR